MQGLEFLIWSLPILLLFEKSDFCPFFFLSPTCMARLWLQLAHHQIKISFGRGTVLLANVKLEAETHFYKFPYYTNIFDIRAMHGKWSMHIVNKIMPCRLKKWQYSPLLLTWTFWTRDQLSGGHWSKYKATRWGGNASIMHTNSQGRTLNLNCSDKKKW